MAYVSEHNQKYLNSMERNYEIVDPTQEIPIERFDIDDRDFEGNSLSPEFGMKISDIGVSTPPFKDQLEALKARIFQGASKIELGFMGQGKGSASQGQYTPESYGTEERRDIRELARLNNITLTSHAAVHGNSLAGFGQGEFNERQRESTIHEIQKAVDFAADTQKGGAIVFHLSEFPRPVSEWYGDQGFKAYDLEAEKAQFLLVDQRTGQVIDQVRKDRRVVTPEWQTDRKGDYILDESGFRIPEFKEGKWEEYRENGQTKQRFIPGEFQVKDRGWDYFEREAKKWNDDHPNDKRRTAAEQQYHDQLDMQIFQARAFAKLRGGNLPEMEKQKEKYQKALSIYSNIEKSVPANEKWKLTRTQGGGDLVPGEEKLPSEIIKEALASVQAGIDFERAEVGQYAQAETLQKLKENTIPVEEYAVKKTADSIARAGIHAMKRTEHMKTQPFNKNVKIDPLFVAVENAHYPDVWGAHPQELKEAIVKSRQAMENMLVHQGYKRDQAHHLAEDHIKATVDIGHANTWRKFFQGDPNKSIEANDKEFKHWLIGQMDDLIKAKVIGHVHVTDNFGYDDEHLVPGTGNAPIKEFLDRVKKLNPSIIVEPAHQDYRALLGGWKRYGNGIYALPRGERDTWADVEHSYFGKPAPPYFLFGETAPDPESWQLWSQTRLE